MNYCSRCVLPDTFPAITFDDSGTCNYCRNIPLPSDEEKKTYMKRFEDLIQEKRGKSTYDVLLAFSGGKDSTYTLMILAQEYNLKILAFTFDNGFVSEQAKTNILKVTDVLGSTSIFLRPPFGLMKHVFGLAAKQTIYSPKTLDRASSICTTCIGMVKAMILKTALSYNIPLVAFGWSPGQAPISSAIMQTNPRLQKISQRTVRDPLLEVAGDMLKPYFLNDDDLAVDASKWPVNIHPLAFFDYDEEAIMRKIADIGWIKPEDTDPNSTNCLLNALANYIHRQKFSFHPYAWEIAGIVRSGSMDREKGLHKVCQDEDMDMVRYAADLLGVDIPS
jgi:tRNA(Ile)-lysidine synthase TilS/MesJ